MENAELRDAIIRGFARLPGTNSILCCLRFSKIQSLHTDVIKCVHSLARDGLLESFIHDHRLPTTYCLSESGKLFSRILGRIRELSPYKCKILEQLHQEETRSAQLQEMTLVYLSRDPSIYPSTLMIQDHLKLSHLKTLSVLCELVKTNDIQHINNHLLWKINPSSVVNGSTARKQQTMRIVQ